MSMQLPSHTLETAAAHNLGMQDAKSWVDWATQALVEGFDSSNLRILAGLTPPYDELEVGRLSRSALAALGVTPLSEHQAVVAFTAAILQRMLSGQMHRRDALERLKDLHLARHYDPATRDFYLLFHALDDLGSEPRQWYGGGATRENIAQIIDECAADWLRKNDGDRIAEPSAPPGMLSKGSAPQIRRFLVGNGASALRAVED